MAVRKLRWAMDGGFWDLDASTPRTVDGSARPVPGDPIPLGLSRGTSLSRPRQIDFMQRFMSAPFVPSYSGHPKSGGSGLSLQRVLSVPLGESWFFNFLGQFNLQKFVSLVRKRDGLTEGAESSWLQGVKKHIRDKSLYSLNLCSEMLLSHDDTLLISSEEYANGRSPRRKVVFQHEFPHHNLTVEAAWPGLFIDDHGTYWDVPSSVAIDLASVASDSGASYHLCLHHNEGMPKPLDSDDRTVRYDELPTTLLPGLALKGAFSFKKNIDLWRSKAQKLKMVQPYDIFLSNPHASASWAIGAAATASVGDNSARSKVGDDSRDFRGVSCNAGGIKSSLLADLFGSVAFTAQLGNFQRLFLDLTRLHARLDFPSGAKFLTGATRLTRDFLNSQQPTLETLQAVCPDAHLSLQQQIGGPFSLRVDSRVAVDLKNRWRPLRVEEPVFAIEYAMQVLGSAKATAWYSPKQQEFMIELRFFET
ncbi:hypothetical protein CRG98_043609 [Punica granatum]|uniref:Protein TRIGALACTOSYLDIACYLGLYCEROL 4, chloroplastic n=1 Tax=Punica granatum TaxID=22663 RepID=A0A2I0HWF3_PUNGR|nr:hypothetical protein CRG98_043609 [Punica granatum]